MKPNDTNTVVFVRERSSLEYVTRHVKRVFFGNRLYIYGDHRDLPFWNSEGNRVPLFFKLDESHQPAWQAIADRRSQGFGRRWVTADWQIDHCWGALEHFYVLADGSISQIHPDIIEFLGNPVDIERPAHLSSTPGTDWSSISNTFWMDKTGTIAFFGNRYNQQLAVSTKRVKTIESARFNDPNADEESPIKLKTRRVSQLRQIHNALFLYRQRLLIYDVQTDEERETYFYGLGHTMSLKFSQTQSVYLRLAEHFNDINAFKGMISNLDEGGVVNPLSRYGYQSYPGNLSSNDWNTWASKTQSNFRALVPENLTHGINTRLAMGNSPLALKLKKLVDSQAKKQKEVDALNQRLQDLEKERQKLDHQILASLKRIEELKDLVLQSRSRLPEIAANSAEAGPKYAREQMRMHKLDSAVEQTQQQYEVRKQDYLKKIQSGEIQDYNKGLAASGIRITDMVYCKISDPRARDKYNASSKPSLVEDSNYWLQGVYLETTRPIVISMGLPEEEARVSGPHKIHIRRREQRSAPEMYIAPLYPWSIMGHYSGTMKPYPHTGGTGYDNGSVRDWWNYVRANQVVCMGDLNDSVYRAFRQNSPQSIALATLGFLQSVRKDDAYGQFYKHFPKVSEVSFEGLPVASEPPPPPTKQFFYMNDDETRYVHYIGNKQNGYDIYFGDVVDGIITSRSTINRKRTPGERIVAGGVYLKLQRLKRPLPMPRVGPASWSWSNRSSTQQQQPL